MIPAANIITMFVVALFTFLAPLVLMVVLGAKRKLEVKALFLGAVAFIVLEMIVRTPMLNYVSTDAWFVGIQDNVWLYGLLLAATSAIISCAGRWGLAKGILRKDDYSFQQAFSYGLGYSMVESSLMVGSSALMNAIVALMCNSGKLAAGGMDAEAAASIAEQLMAIGISDMLLTTAERICGMGLQIFLSALLFLSLREKKLSLLWAALAVHFVYLMGASVLTEYAGAVAAVVWMAVLTAAGLWLFFGKMPARFSLPARKKEKVRISMR